MRLRQRVREFAYARGFGLDEAAEQNILDGAAGVPPGSLTKGRLLAVQVAKNKATPDDDLDAVRNDYVSCVKTLARYADIITVNVSSPNTPGLRDLQKVEPLTKILKGVVEAAAAVDRRTRPAVMVKVSPDEDSDSQVQGICDAIWESGVDGVIVGNTTKKRPEPIPNRPALTAVEQQILLEQGGFSGPHLFQQTVDLVKKYRKHLDAGGYGASSERSSQDAEQLVPSVDTAVVMSKPRAGLTDSGNNSTPKVIFATGGVTNGQQALEILNAGASVAMVYTALVYGGSGTITRIKQEMRKEMEQPSKA
jgi:dihydroorotate dehydrogenase